MINKKWKCYYFLIFSTTLFFARVASEAISMWPCSSQIKKLTANLQRNMESLFFFKRTSFTFITLQELRVQSSLCRTKLPSYVYWWIKMKEHNPIFWTSKGGKVNAIKKSFNGRKKTGEIPIFYVKNTLGEEGNFLKPHALS